MKLPDYRVADLERPVRWISRMLADFCGFRSEDWIRDRTVSAEGIYCELQALMVTSACAPASFFILYRNNPSLQANGFEPPQASLPILRCNPTSISEFRIEILIANSNRTDKEAIEVPLMRPL